MYYEEKMINGVMCWRATPTSDFVPYDLKELSQRYADLKEQFEALTTNLTEFGE